MAASLLVLLAFTSAAQAADKQLVATITAEQLKGGLVSEITWDTGVLFCRGSSPSHQAS